LWLSSNLGIAWQAPLDCVDIHEDVFYDLLLTPAEISMALRNKVMMDRMMFPVEYRQARFLDQATGPLFGYAELLRQDLNHTVANLFPIHQVNRAPNHETVAEQQHPDHLDPKVVSLFFPARIDRQPLGNFGKGFESRAFAFSL
jgi:hypothetical protein